MDVGKRIKEIRELKGITQSFINNEMAKSKGWLANIEKGSRQISASDLIEVAKLMGMSMQEFFSIPFPEEMPGAENKNTSPEE
ncbi:MAG: helix-turn-helix transcriptional regulator [Syntrophomonas sp.]